MTAGTRFGAHGVHDRRTTSKWSPDLSYGSEVSEVWCSGCADSTEHHAISQCTRIIDQPCSRSMQKQTQLPKLGREVPFSCNIPQCSLLTKLHTVPNIKEKCLLKCTEQVPKKWICSREAVNPVLASGFLGFICRYYPPKVSQDLT